MKRWLKWAVPVVVVALIGGFVARALSARKQEQAALGAPKAPTALELSPGDLLVLHAQPFARTLAVSGPDHARTYRVAAFNYLLTGTWPRYDEAMASFGVDVEQEDAGLLFLRALEALRRRSARDEALTLLKQALGKNPRLVRAQAKLVLLQEDIAASYAELIRLEAMAPTHPIVRITGPLIKSDYELSRSFERARSSTGP